MNDDNWIRRQLEIVAKEAETWPEWRRQNALTRFNRAYTDTTPPSTKSKDARPSDVPDPQKL